jgi:hypothetical protein
LINCILKSISVDDSKDFERGGGRGWRPPKECVA